MLHDDAPLTSLQQAAARSLDYLEKLAPERSLPALDHRISVAELTTMLNALSNGLAANSTVPQGESEGEGLSAAAVQQICERFRLYRAESPEPLLVTGYYQPELAASRKRTKRFHHPLYRTPEDLIDVDLGQYCTGCEGRVVQGRARDGKFVPYYSRAEIDAGVLADHDYELAWLDDPVEAFFMHVQGSALLRFDDGVHMQVSYSSSNGRPYTSLGRVLIEQGKVSRDTVSLQTLKDYLSSHPDEQAALMATNDRYIFFRTVVTGPIGSLGVPLTGGRSIAADASVYPPGALTFVRIKPREPTGAGIQHAITRLAFIQDAGTAIAGPSRIDVYWGSGTTAEALAGDMRNPGELYLLLPH